MERRGLPDGEAAGAGRGLAGEPERSSGAERVLASGEPDSRGGVGGDGYDFCGFCGKISERTILGRRRRVKEKQIPSVKVGTFGRRLRLPACGREAWDDSGGAVIPRGRIVCKNRPATHE